MKARPVADFRRDMQIRLAANEREYTRIMYTLWKNGVDYLRSFFNLLLATLREIFDENAYQRFLERTGQGVSVQSYREFQRERELGIATRPRCC